MDVCVIGSGVIGSIYGHALAEAGNDVTHLVRPGRGTRLRDGLEMRLLDARAEGGDEVRVTYRPRVVEALDADRPYDLILASVRHYQVPELLPVLAAGAGPAEILFFNNLWTSFESVDAYLRGRYLWGFPVAGGGFEGRVLHAAILGDVELGSPVGRPGERVERASQMFSGCGFRVEIQSDILAWLWVHFAVEAGVIATAIKAGGVDDFLGSVDRIADAVLAVRDALAVVRARGVNVDAQPAAQMFAAPERVVAQGIKELYEADRAARRIMERHAGGEELKRIYLDVVDTGQELGIIMPVLEPLRPFVEALAASQA
jgi:2-dehydropantoate 2-reductase